MPKKDSRRALEEYHRSDRDRLDAALPKKESTIRILKDQTCNRCAYFGKRKPNDIADALSGYCPYFGAEPNTCNWWKDKYYFYPHISTTTIDNTEDEPPWPDD